MGNPLEAFTDSVNHYAATHGLAPMTTSTIRKLMDERIIPRPSRPGQGRGKGRSAIYSDQAFRRTIMVLKLKKAGLHRFSQIRLWFFFKCLERAVKNRSMVFNVPESLVKEDLQRELYRFVKTNASCLERDTMGQNSLSRKQKKLSLYAATSQMPNKDSVVKALDNLLNLFHGLDSGFDNVSVIPDNFDHNFAVFLPKASQLVYVLEDNPILKGFNSLFPENVSFMDWSIKIFRFMQYLVQRSSISVQKENVAAFLEQNVFMFMIMLFFRPLFQQLITNSLRVLSV